MSIGLNEEPQYVSLPNSHFLYVEKIGPFSETAKAAWDEVLPLITSYISQHHQITGYLSTYRFQPQQTYRAGVTIAEYQINDLNTLPRGLGYYLLPAGLYASFTLIGSYEQLPTASGRVFEIVKEKQLSIDESRWKVERYLNNPETTPKDELITHIMIPVSNTPHTTTTTTTATS